MRKDSLNMGPYQGIQAAMDQTFYRAFEEALYDGDGEYFADLLMDIRSYVDDALALYAEDAEEGLWGQEEDD